MALHLRKRGNVWHARGTVRVGRETISVPEFSTGCSARVDAEAAAETEAARIRADALGGAAARERRLTVADCLASYIKRPGGLEAYDVKRCADFNEAMGTRSLVEVGQGWQEWISHHPHHSPATLARCRTILQAALNHGAAAHSVTPPKLPTVRQPRASGQDVPMLSDADAEALIRSYNPHAACPALLLAELGMRTSEALHLGWHQINMAEEEIRILAGDTKSGRGRAVPMTRRVAMLLWGMWNAAGRPSKGQVFLSSKGKPYAETRGRTGKTQGGNPLTQAHSTACKRAGITGFRVHDWRHHRAATWIMGGMDLFTLMRLCGWSSLKMVEQRYGAVTARHMREAVRRV